MSDLVRELPLTAVRSIRIQGLATDPSGEFVELRMPRTQAETPRNETFKYEEDLAHFYHQELPPINLPSSPLPHELTELHLELGTPTSGNKRHAVYSVKVMQPTPPDFYIPPLMVKIATTARASQNLAREAGMYGHIEALQGVLAPRCYGYFRAEREHGTWHVKLVRTTLDTSSTESEPEPDGVIKEYVAEDPTTISREVDRIDVLLLEKMGDHLPKKQPVSGEHIIEMNNIRIELAEQHVVYNDWRAANLMRAPESPPGLPSKPSPYSGRVYQLRYIDFEHAMVTNMKPELLELTARDCIVDLLNSIQHT
ncbi:hypothetical protein C8Q80DRAFT_950714 [Daedaleopsis nitida]|nr:hypothetical protein C8Q80DRAFT_950714 [Daedaleopsis nitida]